MAAPASDPNARPQRAPNGVINQQIHSALCVSPCCLQIPLCFVASQHQQSQDSKLDTRLDGCDEGHGIGEHERAADRGEHTRVGVDAVGVDGLAFLRAHEQEATGECHAARVMATLSIGDQLNSSAIKAEHRDVVTQLGAGVGVPIRDIDELAVRADEHFSRVHVRLIHAGGDSRDRAVQCQEEAIVLANRVLQY